MRDAEAQSGVDYEQARRDFDSRVGGYEHTIEAQRHGNPNPDDYQRYQQAASQISDRQGLGNNRWDSVAECYMLNGPDIREVPWENGDDSEIDAFVSEELYVHTKVRDTCPFDLKLMLLGDDSR
jgi:phospholipase D1/2